MKKFARCVLILILVVIISGVGGYFYEDNTITPMYESVAQLYVVPGTQSEASIRAKDGGLNKDFMIIFSSNVVIEAAQRIAGTTEDISQYLTVSSPADSNIVELKIVNPDQNTAKTYVDAVAQTAVKTTTIIPVESMQILSEGTSSGVSFKQHLYRNTIFIAGAAGVVCIFIEIIVCLILCAFKKKEDRSDDEYEYEARYGRYVYPRHELIDSDAKRLPHENARKASSDDILAAFDDEEDIDFLTKNVMKKAEADYQKEVAAAKEATAEPVSGSKLKVEYNNMPSESEPKVEEKPEVIAEPEPEVVAEPEPEVVAEPEPEIIAEPEPEVVAESEPEIIAEAEVVTEPEPEISSEPESVTESEVEPEAEIEKEKEDVVAKAFASEPEPEVVAEPEPEISSEPETEVVTEPATEPEEEKEDVVARAFSLESEPEVVAEPEPEISSEPEAEVVTESVAETFEESVSEDITEPETEETPEVIEEKAVFDVRILGRIIK